VYFNAWGGSEQTNAYIQWVGAEVRERFGIKLQHVKRTDTAEAVRRVRTERDAGKRSGGSVDMIWINGEDVLTMKREASLFGQFAESLPGFALVNTRILAAAPRSKHACRPSGRWTTC
jgi:putative thiamine transport system substrate-binding protein